MTDTFVFWLVPVTWVVHDLEELLVLPAWHARNEPSLRPFADRPSTARRLVTSLPAARGTFAVAAIPVGLVLVGATLAGVADPRGVGLLVFSVGLGWYAVVSAICGLVLFVPVVVATRIATRVRTR